MTEPLGGWGSSATLDVSGTSPVPFGRLSAVELRKMADTRAGKWLLITIGLITVLVVGLVVAFAPDEEKTFVAFMGATGTPQGFLLPVLGVLLVTSEWGQRAALTTFTLVPHRGRILWAKAAAAVIFGLAAIAVAIVVAVVATLVAGGPDAWQNFGIDDIAKLGLLQTMGILQGLAFGMVFLNSAGAIVAYFVVPIAFSILTGLTESIREIQPWIDLSTSQTPLFSGEPMSAEQWEQLATGTLIWIVLPMLAGAVRVLRAEVK